LFIYPVFLLERIGKILMSINSQPGRSGFTRLRDFGAFQTTNSASEVAYTGPITPVPEGVHTGPVTPLAISEPLSLSPELLAGSSSEGWRSSLSNKWQQRWFRLSLQIVITCILLLLLSFSISWPMVLSTLAHVRKSILLVAVVVGASGVVLSAYQWRSLLRSAQLHFDLADLIDFYVIGIAFSHVLPTGMGGDAVKILYVGSGEDERMRSTGAILLCRLTGFFAMLLIAVPTLCIWHAQLSSALGLWSSVLLGIGVVSIIALFLLFSVLQRFLSRFERFPLFKSFFQMNRVLHTQFWRPRALLGATCYGLVFWCVAILNCYCYALALGLAVPFYFYLIAVPFVALISFIPLSLNGFGLREGAFVFAFTSVHVSPAHALLLALLLDLQALFFALLGVYLYFTGRHKRRSLAAL
jgi:glycosyltransferase 2 family protein